MAAEKTLLDTIEVQQDIGSHEPRYKRVELQLWSDGSVTWKKPEREDLDSKIYGW